MSLKLITWNCRVGGSREKAKYIAPKRPDVLAVQEVEPIDGVRAFAGERQPTFRDRRADPAFPRRAIGVFSYTDTQLRPVDVPDPLFSFRRYEARHGDLLFNVVAVWPWQTKSSKTAYRQAHEGLIVHAGWIRKRSTVILGDFNADRITDLGFFDPQTANWFIDKNGNHAIDFGDIGHMGPPQESCKFLMVSQGVGSRLWLTMVK